MGNESWKNRKILIVDDQYGIRVLLKEILQTEGFRTFQASNGIQALSMVERHHPDLILLDMKIPNMDGLEILKRVNEQDFQTKVIIMTAYGELDMIEEAMRRGALTYFSKPFDIEEVLNLIKKELA
ncbi:MAG TPA: response regulator [Bacillales bacterium]|nr:response regulator [Bacillales bacterium]